MGERNAIQQTLNVASDAVGGHDERGVDGVDIAAGHRSARMPNQGGDGCLGEPKIIADAGEAVPQDMRGDAREFRILEQLCPLPREAAEWRSILSPGAPSTY